MQVLKIIVMTSLLATKFFYEQHLDLIPISYMNANSEVPYESAINCNNSLCLLPSFMLFDDFSYNRLFFVFQVPVNI